MGVISEELYSLLIPLRDERLVVPRSCVAEVVRYSPDNDSPQTGWQRGQVDWREQQVQVISFEALLGLPEPGVSGRTRLAIFYPLAGRDRCPAYGVLAQGFPQMVRINSEVVQPDDSYTPPAGAPVICRINMLAEQALIPDLEALEERLAGIVSTEPVG